MSKRVIAGTRVATDGGDASPSVWEGRTIGSFLHDRVVSSPEVVAVVEGDTVLTYGQLGDAVSAVAAGLRSAGVVAGSSVLVQLPNWWEALVVFHAISEIGAVANPVIPIYRKSEVGFIIDESQPSAIVVPETFRGFGYQDMIDELCAPLGEADKPALVVVRSTEVPSEPWISFDSLCATAPLEKHGAASVPGDVTLLLYTSGTTAAPKGVLHSHETLVYETRSILDWFSLGAQDHVFMASPITHITGFLYGFILPPMTGATVVLMDVWEPRAGADLIEQHACRFTVAATPFLQGLCDEYARRDQPSALRHFACGGADVPPDLVRRATAVLGTEVCRVYGSSEFPTFSCGRAGDSMERRADTDGVAIAPAVGRIDPETGELQVKGPELFHGYLDSQLNDASFTSDGYFKTGDLASMDADGYVTIGGRIKDIIIRNGENISAREVEDVLYGHPHIDDVAVVALPDERTGERACAVVVSHENALTLDDLRDHLRSNGVATQKWPEQLHLIEELPRTASGKVQKFLLRGQLSN